MKRLLQLVVAIAVAGLAWGVIERRWFVLRHQTIPALQDPQAPVLRVLHLSDLHLAPGDRRMAAFIRGALTHGPDLIVVTGDILGHADAIDDAVALLASVGADRPAIAVLGSNDRYGPVLRNPLRYLWGPTRHHPGGRLDTERLVVGLKEAGWHVLRNERVTVPTAAGDIDVVGLDDPHIGADSPAQVDWTAPAGPCPLRLGVVHSPYMDVLRQFAAHGFGLTLAGHTHGGQVRVPGIGALVDNCDLPLKMARGPSRVDGGMWLHVSAGLGTSRYAPVRFACRPEASILDLVAPPRDAIEL
ncbi:MAG: metallophosphoesterase [Actinobacteria bacterium]|nr:metallophosphoesterase [Actinomycetota bacterium]